MKSTITTMIVTTMTRRIFLPILLLLLRWMMILFFFGNEDDSKVDKDSFNMKDEDFEWRRHRSKTIPHVTETNARKMENINYDVTLNSEDMCRQWDSIKQRKVIH